MYIISDVKYRGKKRAFDTAYEAMEHIAQEFNYKFKFEKLPDKDGELIWQLWIYKPTDKTWIAPYWGQILADCYNYKEELAMEFLENQKLVRIIYILT